LRPSPRQGVTRLQAKKGAPGVILHALGSARECEGIDPHTPKGIPTLGVGVSVGFPNFQRAIARVKTRWLEDLFISLENP